MRVSPVRPGREHDTTCARAHGLSASFNGLAATLDIPTLTDCGHENAGDSFRHPVNRPQGRELILEQKTFNKVIPGIRRVAERANALLKVTFKTLRRENGLRRA
ncbi:transposase family protein [Streptomyces mirabilis]|nr:transposase family protein [Streptomyces mirabilis]MCX4435897.1 transposase family protein [Streptomyces mirabilis]